MIMRHIRCCLAFTTVFPHSACFEAIHNDFHETENYPCGALFAAPPIKLSPPHTRLNKAETRALVGESVQLGDVRLKNECAQVSHISQKKSQLQDNCGCKQASAIQFAVVDLL